MLINFNRRAIFYLTTTICIISIIVLSLKSDLHRKTLDKLGLETGTASSPLPSASPTPHDPEPASPPPSKHPKYKPPPSEPPLVIVDNFPLAANATRKSALPPIPSWNLPPKPHVPEKTPLFIGFTRNWRILQQAVVSYITAGWPPEDIYVIENTGTMDANRRGLLTLQNPFYLNHTRLHDLFGINIIVTPTLLTFAQLQNFMLWTAIENKYKTYFWSHMDIVALSYEDKEPYKSLYLRAVDTLRESLNDTYHVDPATGEKQRWAIRFFAYDHLALVNVKAYEEVGGWDTQIPFYMTDCDMHERLTMKGLVQEEALAGLVYDVSDSLDDLEVLYRKVNAEKEPSFSLPPGDGWKGSFRREEQRDVVNEERDGVIGKRLLASWGSSGSEEKTVWEEAKRGGGTYRKLMDTCDAMRRHKAEQKGGRNSWQARQGGLGVEKEPYYKNPQGFEQAMIMWQEFGRRVFAEKWGHQECAIRAVGLGDGDEWRVEHDWKIKE